LLLRWVLLPVLVLVLLQPQLLPLLAAHAHPPAQQPRPPILPDALSPASGEARHRVLPPPRHFSEF